MKKQYSKIILIWIAVGIVIGSVIGLLGVYGLMPQAHFLSVTNFIIKLCFDIIVLLIDGLCIWALCRPAINWYLNRNGQQTIGRIEDVTVIPRPDQLGEDAWIQKARFALIISYEIGAKQYRKEYSPTCLTSRRELYPQSIEIGEAIPVQYAKKNPNLSCIDIDPLKTGLKQEQANARPYFIITPIVITATYILVRIVI